MLTLTACMLTQKTGMTPAIRVRYNQLPHQRSTTTYSDAHQQGTTGKTVPESTGAPVNPALFHANPEQEVCIRVAAASGIHAASRVQADAPHQRIKAVGIRHRRVGEVRASGE